MHNAPALEMWGGVECTVNRVGDRDFDQIARTGHMDRLDDLDRFADLGIRALRFPLLWEHVQPERDAAPDWRWADRALPRLRGLGVRPILGLLHHGFGPRWIDVRDPAFAEEFAQYARMVAERYPWVDAYTPINEPLTTARFSTLYGHWYPHGRDDGLFARTFLAQLIGIAQAMREIRGVNSDAQLVQTEDLGEIASTPALEYQRDFENERRWQTWDILSGMLAPGDATWEYLCGTGQVHDALATLREAPCAPDVIGINHYITSERFLDDRVERYALDEIGGNGRDVYADVARVRVHAARRAGVAELLRQTWRRYHRPIAVTECHIGCTREEQMRWLREVWDSGALVRSEGVDVRAITSWALLGSHDWNSLVTCENGHYEPGAFDTRAHAPRRTALSSMIRELATRGSHANPVLESPGWWNRQGVVTSSRPIVIANADGPMGRALAAACESRGLAHVELDDPEPGAGFAGLDPWAVIDVRRDASTAERLASACSSRGVQFVSLTLAFTFDDRKDGAHVESDAPALLHGASDALLIRGGILFGCPDGSDLLTRALVALAAGESFEASDHLMVTPAYLPDLAHAVLDLLIDGERGTWHLTNGTAVAGYDLVERAARRLNLSVELLAHAPAGEVGPGTHRWHLALASERGWPMPSLDSALDRYAASVRDGIAAVSPYCLSARCETAEAST